MSSKTRDRARAAKDAAAEVTEVVLAEPQAEVVPLERAPAAMAEEIRRRIDEIDLEDSGSIVAFGAAAQAELRRISQSMLSDVRNKDTGPAGESLRQIVTALRGFTVAEGDIRRKPTLWERMTGKAAPLASFLARFEQVQDQIDKITGTLLEHEHRLLKDIKSLDLLYDRTLEFYDELGLYIAAGEARLAALDTRDIPALVAASGDGADETGMRAAQKLRDLRSLRDDLDRRVQDLRLTRQVTMQSLPSIRLVQENDKSLVTKINSTLVNTVPLWETQMAQAVTIHRSAEAAGALREAGDLTNELLEANAGNLRQANQAVRGQMERGVFDIESIRAANADLIGTIEDSLRIAEDGRRKRAEAAAELKELETALRGALAAARAPGPEG